MGWAIFFEILLALMPYILKWLEELLRSKASQMGMASKDPIIFKSQLKEIFDEAEKELPYWQFWKLRRRFALQAVRKVVMRRPEEFRVAMIEQNPNLVTPLTADESETVRQAFVRASV